MPKSNVDSGRGRPNVAKRGARKATPEKLSAIRLAVLRGARVEDAARQHGICDETYFRHQRANTPEWQEAGVLFLTTFDGELAEAARKRALEILTTGQDGAAAQVLIRVLGLTDKHEVKSDATHRLVQERQDLLETMMQDPEFGPLMSRMTERVERERER